MNMTSRRLISFYFCLLNNLISQSHLMPGEFSLSKKQQCNCFPYCSVSLNLFLDSHLVNPVFQGPIAVLRTFLFTRATTVGRSASWAKVPSILLLLSLVSSLVVASTASFRGTNLYVHLGGKRLLQELLLLPLVALLRSLPLMQKSWTNS